MYEIQNGAKNRVRNRPRHLPACRARKYANGYPTIRQSVVAIPTYRNVRRNAAWYSPSAWLMFENENPSTAVFHVDGFHAGTGSCKIASTPPNAMAMTT